MPEDDARAGEIKRLAGRYLSESQSGAASSSTTVPPVVKRIAEQTPESPVPICVLVVGMAGSGKTTLMSQLQNYDIMSFIHNCHNFY